MKVMLAVCGTEHYCGLPKYFYFLAKHLAKNGVEVELIIDTEQGVKHLSEVCQGVRTKLIKPACQVRFNAPSTAVWCWRVAQYLKNEDFDILHCGHVTPYFYLRQRNRKPVVFQPFGSELIAFEQFKAYKGLARCYYTMAKSILGYCGKNCDVLLAEEEWQLEELRRLYKRTDSIILPVGIDIDFIKMKTRGQHRIRQKLGVGSTEFVTLTVNTFHSHKDYLNLITALSLLKDKVPNIKAIMVGTGPEAELCMAVTRQLGLVGNTRYLKNLPEEDLYGLYEAADCYVSPTQCVDFQMGIAEAEALGLPIVSTAQDFMINGNGYVVPSNDSVALANGILKVMESDRVAMGKKSREIAEQWDFKQIARKAIGIYETIL